ncbi:STAS-like domain-containing protein [Patescibacteria group bacterium]|nr:STAS-like domain-containing protein [Patescibacteria group bacterium]
MIIKLEKFGTTLLSRQAGKEAALACQTLLRDIKNNEKIEVDFKGVSTFSPSWGDEFLTPLLNKYKDKLVLKITDNLSVIATIEMLETIHKKKFKIIK